MSIYNLNALFKPKRIAIVHHPKDRDLSEVLFRNLILRNFKGTVYPISPDGESFFGIEPYPNLLAVPKEIDLCILAGGVEHWLEEVENCKRKGVKALLLIHPDFNFRVPNATDLLQKIRLLTRKYGIRTLGPNSLGFIVPNLNLNASLFDGEIPQGHIGFISDSSTMAIGLLDWAIEKRFGFSAFISLGEKVDVDLPDAIDYLGYDPSTRAILIHLESIESGRKFLRSVRGFARSKPMIVIKSKSSIESLNKCTSILDGIATEDLIYSSAFKRAGMVEVSTIEDLFYLAEGLEKLSRPKGPRLALVSNSGGLTDIALKFLREYRLTLPNLSQELKTELSAKISNSLESHDNPIKLLSDSPPSVYKNLLESLLKSRDFDAIIILLSPTHRLKVFELAMSIVSAWKASPIKKPIFIVPFGAKKVEEAKTYLLEQGLAVFDTPEQAIKTFYYLYQYEHNIDLLFETPSNILEDFIPDKERGQRIIFQALKKGRTYLNLSEGFELLKAYGIPVPKYRMARNEEELLVVAEELGYPLSLCLNETPYLTYGQQMVETKHQGIYTEKSLLREARELWDYAEKVGLDKNLLIFPYTAEQTYELLLGTKKDPVFGAIIVVGIGGKEVKLGYDQAIGLPPLNQTIARRLLEETIIYHHLKLEGYPIGELESLMVKFSMLIVDFPEIANVVINPLLLTRQGVLVQYLKVNLEEVAIYEDIKPTSLFCPSHLSICPYPTYFSFHERLKDGTEVFIRPVKPEDEPLLKELFYKLSEKSTELRFNQPGRKITREELIRFCHIDYDQEMTLIALVKNSNGKSEIIGAGHLIKSYEDTAELAFEVRDDYQGKGLGKTLMQKLLQWATLCGYKTLWMGIRKDNLAMLRLAKTFGFEVSSSEEDMVYVQKNLSEELPQLLA